MNRCSVLPVAAVLVLFSGCSVGSIGSSSGGGHKTTIRYSVGNDSSSTKMAKSLIHAFEKKHDNITVKLDTRPQGTEGDNLVKTRLSTGDMADVFAYNSGSLFQQIKPDKNLTLLNDEPWVKHLDKTFKPQVSTDKGVYGAPMGASGAGGVLYNRTVYKKLHLTPPSDWKRFLANSEKIAKAKRIAPVIQTYGETYTSQVPVLGDFGNVAAQDPNWAEQYTKHNRSYAKLPALQGFLNLAQMHKKKLFNKNFKSAGYDDGVKLLATGKGAQYPMLSSTVSELAQNYPKKVKDIGIFALPAQESENTRLTTWLPSGLYIPKDTDGDKLDAAKKFIEFVESEKGCKLQMTVSPPSGPPSIDTCKLPEDAPQIAKDVEKYYNDDKVEAALEFQSPVKGPNLEKLTVEVGSGIRSPHEAAKLYDKDVQKQAKQLDLPGW